MKRFISLAFFSALMASASLMPLPLVASAKAQPTSSQSSNDNEQSPLEHRADQVVALINGEIEPGEVFTNGFLSAVPPQQFKAIADQLTSQFGAAVSVETLDPPSGNRASLAIRMERAIASGGIAINANEENRISELLFQSFEPINDSISKIEADLSALEGEVTWWLGPLGDSSAKLSSSNPEKPMPIGSTFKLYVLAALAQDIADGKRSWSDQVLLPDTRSFPSGMIQNWPKNAPISLHTLASLMISISDNTATDILIDEIGREAILATMSKSGHSNPSLNEPFLKTREMFLLKAGPKGRLETYQRANAQLRGQILDGIEDISLQDSTVQAAFAGGPIALDVEWFASAIDIGRLFQFMRKNGDPEAFAIMAINPSMTKDLRQRWEYVGFKGGSEPGVLNLSWLLRDADGNDHALILSWRNDDLRFNPTSLELIAQRFLSLKR